MSKYFVFTVDGGIAEFPASDFIEFSFFVDSLLIGYPIFSGHGIVNSGHVHGTVEIAYTTHGSSVSSFSNFKHQLLKKACIIVYPVCPFECKFFLDAGCDDSLFGCEFGNAALCTAHLTL